MKVGMTVGTPGVIKVTLSDEDQKILEEACDVLGDLLFTASRNGVHTLFLEDKVVKLGELREVKDVVNHLCSHGGLTIRS